MLNFLKKLFFKKIVVKLPVEKWEYNFYIYNARIFNFYLNSDSYESNFKVKVGNYKFDENCDEFFVFNNRWKSYDIYDNNKKLIITCCKDKFEKIFGSRYKHKNNKPIFVLKPTI